MKSINEERQTISQHSLFAPHPRPSDPTRAAPLARLALGMALLQALTVPAIAIVNGEVDVEETFPSVGALVINTDLPNTLPGVGHPQSFSTGTLVGPRVMLTSGHTVEFMETIMAADGVTLDAFRVSFAVDAHDPDSFLEIESVHKHPQYVHDKPGEASFDVGMVILKTAQNVDPVVLPPAGLLNDLVDSGGLSVAHGRGTPLVVVGYGVDAPPPHPLLILPSGIRQWAISGYQALMPSYLTLSQNLGQGEGGNALGDSGGPAFWIDPDSGDLVQVGIASLQNPVAAGMVQYARADLVEVIEFIEGLSTTGAGWETASASAALDPAARIASVTVRILTRPSLGARHKTAQKYAESVVIIVDDLGNGVEGALVTGTFTGNLLRKPQTVSGRTAASGAVVLTLSKSVGWDDSSPLSFTFCVDDVESSPPWDGNLDNACDTESY